MLKILFPHRFFCGLASILFFLCSASFADPIPTLAYTLINSADHNPKSFTQGWVKEGNMFYESSGLYGKSFITRYRDTLRDTLHAQKTIQGAPQKNLSPLTRSLANNQFAEGLTLFNDTLYLLTWKRQQLLLIDKYSFATKKILNYQGEGWGLTHDKQSLIMSNGSSVIYFRDPIDFSVQKKLSIKYLTAINELEYANGIIWANEWNDDNIYGINADTGCLIGKIKLSDLRKKTVTPNASNVLNGIAYDQAQNKFWPKRYLIQPSIMQSTNAHPSKC